MALLRPKACDMSDRFDRCWTRQGSTRKAGEPGFTWVDNDQISAAVDSTEQKRIVREALSKEGHNFTGPLRPRRDPPYQHPLITSDKRLRGLAV